MKNLKLLDYIWKSFLPVIIIFLVVMFVFIGSTPSRNAYAVSGSSQTLVSNVTFNATGTGTIVCLPKLSDDFSLYLKAINSAGSTPTLDVVVQHSDDQSNWTTLDTFTQATTGTSTQLRHINGTTTHVLKCVRISATVGGTSSPTWNLVVKVFYRLRA